MKKHLVLLAIMWLPLLQACGQAPDKAYALMLKGLYNNTVPVVAPTDLYSILASEEKKPLLLDTRQLAEYKVSHLAGARFANYDTFEATQLKNLPKDHPIVVYCSVGYRSEQVGEKLRKAGFTNVQNLYGGIFGWVNQGYPVYDSEGKTTKVHAYSRAWGVWLKKGEKVYDK
ncbi:rhodanese-like domain-containing protein [Pontibacter akesuensis]|nr:rhodanese-like domain-containing protein [Pontibacter akesuensis]